MDDIAKKDIQKLISSHRKTHAPGSTNRILILVRYIFNLAIKWETPRITNNPTVGIPLMEENNMKERYLSGSETKKLLYAIKRSENKME
jgi:hypothetical protein